QDLAASAVVFTRRRSGNGLHSARSSKGIANCAGNRDSRRSAGDGRVRARPAQDRPAPDALATRRQLEVDSHSVNHQRMCLNWTGAPGTLRRTWGTRPVIEVLIELRFGW